MTVLKYIISNIITINNINDFIKLFQNICFHWHKILFYINFNIIILNLFKFCLLHRKYLVFQNFKIFPLKNIKH